MLQILLFFLFNFSGFHHDCTSHIDARYVNELEWTCEEDVDRIIWSAEAPLVWDDFQAKPHRFSNIAAITSSVIQYKYFCENNQLTYDINSIFLKDESWVRDFARNARYLRHEQRHFDLSEVYARKLRKTLSQRTYSCDDAYIFESIVVSVLNEWRQTQKRYDRETNFSLNGNAQMVWEDYIDELLTRYEDY